MTVIHNLGFPKIGKRREWKKAIENYWKGKSDMDSLMEFGKNHRLQNWQLQNNHGADYVTTGDFNYYDHILNASLTFGVTPERFNLEDKSVLDIDDMFYLARGRSKTMPENNACEMTKWFDTNYHYIVPEFTKYQKFSLKFFSLLNETKEAIDAGFKAKPILIGPLTYLFLGKNKSADFNKLDLLPSLLIVYKDLLEKLINLGVDYIELDEPMLSLEIDSNWQQAFFDAYNFFSNLSDKLIIATYFSDLGQNETLCTKLPVAGLHLDFTHYTKLPESFKDYSAEKILSVGIIDGRSVWLNNLSNSLNKLKPLYEKYKSNLWLAPSCSLLHCPIDLELEEKIDPEIKSWMAFSVQKLQELEKLQQALKDGNSKQTRDTLASNAAILFKKENSTKLTNSAVKTKVENLDFKSFDRLNRFDVRKNSQNKVLNLPILPTTTIGSFPQTTEIRKLRQDYKKGRLSLSLYKEALKREIDNTIKIQEEIGLDVLVHGEPERNDMVEYFAEQLEGYVVSGYGWVQSYGSRCVKPPIIYGDVYRKQPMTLEWILYAQSRTKKPVKAMLTGPVTILKWSFARDDISAKEIALQIALSIQEEVLDLEKAGIKVIQIDEPALKEASKLKKSQIVEYFNWAVMAFKIASGIVKNDTQIHTHMCYSEFGDIIDKIAAMDADVISIEAARSSFELLQSFNDFHYPNAIGPGVYDIHSPNVPQVSQIELLLSQLLQFFEPHNLWVNPDCGLKTRSWKETKDALTNMLIAVKNLRAKLNLNVINNE